MSDEITKLNVKDKVIDEFVDIFIAVTNEVSLSIQERIENGELLGKRTIPKVIYSPVGFDELMDKLTSLALKELRISFKTKLRERMVKRAKMPHLQ